MAKANGRVDAIESNTGKSGFTVLDISFGVAIKLYEEVLLYRHKQRGYLLVVVFDQDFHRKIFEQENWEYELLGNINELMAGKEAAQ